MKQLVTFVFLSFIAFSSNAQCITGDCQNGMGYKIFSKSEGELFGKKYHKFSYYGWFKNGKRHAKKSYTFYQNNDNSYFKYGEPFFSEMEFSFDSPISGVMYDVYGNPIMSWSNNSQNSEVYTKKLPKWFGKLITNSGWGIEIQKYGDTYEGYFKNEIRNGSGTSYIGFRDGAGFSGQWKDGKEYDGYFVRMNGERERLSSSSNSSNSSSSNSSNSSSSNSSRYSSSSNNSSQNRKDYYNIKIGKWNSYSDGKHEILWIDIYKNGNKCTTSSETAEAYFESDHWRIKINCCLTTENYSLYTNGRLYSSKFSSIANFNDIRNAVLYCLQLEIDKANK